MTVCTPLRVERVALRALRPVHTGMGAARSARARLSGPVLVAGVGGATTSAVRPGDVVVATEVRGAGAPRPCESVEFLVDALRELGLTVHSGPIVSSRRLVTGSARGRLGDALAVDMESAWLATDGPFAVLRVIVDTPDHPLVRPGTLARGITALRTLRRTAPAIRRWVARTHPAQEVS